MGATMTDLPWWAVDGLILASCFVLGVAASWVALGRARMDDLLAALFISGAPIAGILAGIFIIIGRHL